jgi:NAD+ synthase
MSAKSHKGNLKALEINPDVVRGLLVRFIRSEVTRTGMARGVIGLSGGVDSSLVAALAAEALGAANVLGVMLPYRTSNPSSEAHAAEVAALLGIASHRVDITPVVEPYFALNPAMSDRRRGNAMARARMLILFDQSAEFGGLVMGTSNRTETLLGYTTVFGDNAAAIQPIGDLFKCQVRQLARAVGVPEAIVSKPPSADLWAGQTDEGELGFTYDQADQILHLLYDQRYTADEVAAAGFELALVRRVLEIVRRSQYKRQPAPVAKVSARTVGVDFQFARDWGT